jgi:hypothetical protein
MTGAESITEKAISLQENELTDFVRVVRRVGAVS